MATMYQRDSPLPSGRTLLWRTLPVLLLSPIISSYINDHDLLIYLSVGYGFLLFVLIQFRRLCRDWACWIDKVPTFTEDEILVWYSSRLEKLNDSHSNQSGSTTTSKGSLETTKKDAIQAFRQSVESSQRCQQRITGQVFDADSLVWRVAEGLPYIAWLLEKEGQGQPQAELFSVPWFSRLQQALKKQQQMVQGLKDHGAFMLFRYGSYDVSCFIPITLPAVLTCNRLAKTWGCSSSALWTGGSASQWPPSLRRRPSSRILRPATLSVSPYFIFAAL
jgi:hypothetical protein